MKVAEDKKPWRVHAAGELPAELPLSFVPARAAPFNKEIRADGEPQEMDGKL